MSRCLIGQPRIAAKLECKILSNFIRVDIHVSALLLSPVQSPPARTTLSRTHMKRHPVVNWRFVELLSMNCTGFGEDIGSCELHFYVGRKRNRNERIVLQCWLFGNRSTVLVNQCRRSLTRRRCSSTCDLLYYDKRVYRSLIINSQFVINTIPTET